MVGPLAGLAVATHLVWASLGLSRPARQEGQRVDGPGALWLAFAHPIANQPMEFTAEIPADMRAAVELVR